ncbi:MAG: antibiotic biosynthesis monooxygenase [Burkholderiales bacterium]|nr:antibiotic biosynthesis monooxygenase [Burkholderiales bacterium]
MASEVVVNRENGMLMCVIEFGTIPGMEERNRALVTEMLKESARIDGFISKETFVSRDNPAKVITISCWQDQAALDRWMQDPEHRRVIPIGRNELFTHYTIQVAEVKYEKKWRKPGTAG